ncbi:cystatin-F isoform X1 [Oryctolagus cuniculus]|uniref:cystatin-F isoform X1 n=1 Tax=Oryctolagus cuniculus TaxID=9986 RepID=UPI0038794703
MGRRGKDTELQLPTLGLSGRHPQQGLGHREAREPCTSGEAGPDFCSQDLNSGLKPGFPETIKTDDPGVLAAARHSVERFNNCTDDIFLFKESFVRRALVQIVKGLKYMLEVEFSRTTCRKTSHAQLDNCDFQSNHTLKQTLSCYSEVWVIPWLQKVEVPVLRCH